MLALRGPWNHLAWGPRLPRDSGSGVAVGQFSPGGTKRAQRLAILFPALLCGRNHREPFTGRGFSRSGPSFFFPSGFFLRCPHESAQPQGPHSVAVVSFVGSGNDCSTSKIGLQMHDRQWSVVQWWAELSQNQISINNAVGTTRDIFQLPVAVPASGSVTTCAGWHAYFLGLAQADINTRITGQHKSYFWVLPPLYPLTGCDPAEPDTNTNVVQRGPTCGSTGCYAFFRHCPSVSDAVYAIGTHMGLKRSNSRASVGSATVVVGGDSTCAAGRVFDDTLVPGLSRRGFNALKLKDLSLLTATESFGLLGATRLTGLYVTGAVGSVKLIHITGKPWYLSFRRAIDTGVDRNVNLGARWNTAPVLQRITDAVHVHEYGADGSSHLVEVIPTGKQVTLDANTVVQVFWSDETGVLVAISAAGNVVEPAKLAAAAVPDTASNVWTQSDVLDTAQQGSAAGNLAYTSTTRLFMSKAGDDYANVVYVRIRVPVPRGATVTSAVLLLESDLDQYAAYLGRPLVNVAIEQTDNAPALSGDVYTRSTYGPTVPFTFDQDALMSDEMPIEIASLVQSVTSRVGWVANNYVNIRITPAVAGQAAYRSAFTGIYCAKYGSATPCQPRMRVSYTAGGGAPLPVQNCVYVWTSFSQCANVNPLIVCGNTGTQFRTLIVTTEAANGGTACPALALRREERSCTLPACAPTPVDCVVTPGAWGPCNAAGCSSNGTRTRPLYITTQPAYGGKACPTTLSEEGACQSDACAPIDCLVTWDPYGPCTGGLCGKAGNMTRFGRVTTPAQFGGKACGALQETLTCTMPACSQDCVVEYPVSWGDCQRLCPCPCATANNTGLQRRVGVVVQAQLGSGAACPALTLTRSCTATACPAVDCSFTWGEWGACAGLCGISTGTRQRFSTIYSQPLNGGAACPPSSETEQCSTPACGSGTPTYPFTYSPVYGTLTGPVSNAKFDDQQYVVARESFRFLDSYFLYYPPAANSLELRATLDPQFLQGQQLRLSWAFSGGQFQDVAVLNREGRQSLSVTLTSTPFPRSVVLIRLTNSDRTTQRLEDTRVAFDSLVLVGYDNLGPTPVDCQQTAEVAEGPCSTQCGTGSQCLTRQTLVQAANGGRACEPERRCIPCTVSTGCVVDCLISAFGPPSPCSVTCGIGSQTATATIVRPPANGGAACPSLTQVTSCNAGPCPVSQDCVWNDWSAWSTCSAPCGGGTRTRTRTIKTPASGLGLPCSGADRQTETCNTLACTGSRFVVEVRSVDGLDTSLGFPYEEWPSTAVVVPGAADVTISCVGRATDAATFRTANGFFQLSSPSRPCVVAEVTLTCPLGTPRTSIVAQSLGRIQCTSSLSTVPTASAVATFTITC